MVRVFHASETLSDRKTPNNGKETATPTGTTLVRVKGTQANNLEEPGAVIPHAGVCEGAVG